MDHGLRNHIIVDIVGYDWMLLEIINSYGCKTKRDNYPAILKIRCSYLVTGGYDSTYNMSAIRNKLQEYILNDQGFGSMTKFLYGTSIASRYSR